MAPAGSVRGRRMSSAAAVAKTQVAGFTEHSDTGSHKYEIIIYSDGSMYCDGPCWKFQSKKQMEENGLWRGTKRCKHTRKYEPYVDGILNGSIRPEDFGGVRAGSVAKFTNPLPPMGPGEKLDSNLRKRFVRG